MTLKVFILAGEPSGDRLGGALMAGLHELSPGVSFKGVGGPMMKAQGLVSQFPMDELSIMGLAEVLPKYFHLKRRIREVSDAVIAIKPDVLITIDAPDFSLRVAKLVKQSSSVRTVHYVAPSVWAWRPGRAKKMAKVIDHVLALLPFEPRFMKAAGMECDFVGHPVVSEPRATENEVSQFRAEMGLGDAPFVLALPGSRRSEVERLAPVFGEALALFLKEHPGMRIVVPAASPVAQLVREQVQSWSDQVMVLDPANFDAKVAEALKRAAFDAADLALAASGTVSLELAAANTPMVIAYRFQWLTWQIMKRMVLIDTATLVNLVTCSRYVPECLGPDCTAKKISEALCRVADDPSDQQRAMALTMKQLGKGGKAPGLRAARAVLKGLD